MRPLKLNQPLIKCRCGKTFSPTRKEAEKTCEYVARLKGGTPNPVRYYQCKYNGWHWTRELQPIRVCSNCRGPFRIPDEHSTITHCDTCTRILAEQEAAKVERRREEARRRQAAFDARQAATRARIINETHPTPAFMAGKKRIAS